MKIRVLSDLHYDYNGRYMVKIPHGDEFTVFAGDVSGYTDLTIEKIRSIADRGIVVAGNHIVYNDSHRTLGDIKDDLHAEFPDNGDISFLDVSTGTWHKIVDGILFIGSTMYTNYGLKTRNNPEGDVQRNLMAAEPRLSGGGMNDFVYGRIRGEFDVPRNVMPRDYLKMHMETVSKFDAILSQNEELWHLPVVVVTHHAPLKACLMYDKESEDNDNLRLIDASYASDMSAFIESHKSINAWIYGHTHHRKHFAFTRKDGSKCVLLNNSFGYRNHLEDSGFPKRCILDTDTWTVSHEDVMKKRTLDLKKLSKEDLEMIGFGMAWN